MFRSFRKRKPLAAAAIGILFGPVIGMLYVSRAGLALVYLIISLLIMASPFIAAHYGVLSSDPRPAANILGLGINIIGAFHCYFIARKGAGHRRWYARWYILVLALLVPVSLAVGFRTFLYRPYHIPSDSMSPAINDGDYLFADLRAYNRYPPQRGDVIIFESTYPPPAIFVKRIIGLPGDHVQLREGIVYINNVPLPDQRTGNDEIEGAPVPRFTETLPEGREISVLKQPAKGIAGNTPVYNVPDDSYFVLGDNRDMSRDSRFSDFGYVPAQNIIGKAGPVLWNTETHRISFRSTQ